MRVLLLIVFICFISRTYGQYPDSRHKRESAAADISLYPYMANLDIIYRNGGGKTCDGTILDARHILTAGVCLIGNIIEIIISIGSSRTDDGVTYSSNVYAVHRYFNGTTGDYNVGVVITDMLQIGVKNTKPVKLPGAGSKLAPGSSVEVVGWSSASSTSSTEMKTQTVKVVDQTTCSSLYQQDKILVSPRMFCAGADGKGALNACSAQLGSPAVVGGVQVGLVSGGKGCGDKTHPVIYTDVATVLDWIKSKMSKAN